MILSVFILRVYPRKSRSFLGNSNPSTQAKTPLKPSNAVLEASKGFPVGVDSVVLSSANDDRFRLWC